MAGKIFEGNGLVSTVASEAWVSVFQVGAINNLLLREGLKFSRDDLVNTLEGTSGGEGPAGSTLSLVLDWGDGTLCSPVNRVGIGWLKPDCFNINGKYNYALNNLQFGGSFPSNLILCISTYKNTLSSSIN